MAFKEYVMTESMRKKLLNARRLPYIPSLEFWRTQKHENHRTAGPYSRNWNSYKYRQAELGEINCRTCGADLLPGITVRSRIGRKGAAILRCKECDIKVFGNGKVE